MLKEKIIFLWIDVYKTKESHDKENMTVCSPRLKNTNLKIKTESIEKYKNMDEDFDQN